MKTEILRMLKSTEDYLSGQQLCGMLGVSRTAVWKAVGELREEGYVIEAVRNRGYRLVEGADVITQAELASMLHTQWMGPGWKFDETDSTNIRARETGRRGSAPRNTGGCRPPDSRKRAEGGKSWVFPGRYRHLDEHGAQAGHVSHERIHADPYRGAVSGQGREGEHGLEAMIKWPNDAVLNGKKICGILTEMSTEVECIRYVIPGIGINVNIDDFPEEIRATATSLKLEAGRSIKRSLVIAAVADRF